jgi:hypothetical protein
VRRHRRWRAIRPPAVRICLPERRESRRDRNLDRVALASQYTPTVVYPNNGFAGSLRTIAGAIVRGHRLASVLDDHRRL